MKKTNYLTEIKKGNFPLALSMIDKALTRDPENPELLYNFAICCSRTENHKKCIETLNFLLKRSGRFVERDNVFRLIIYSHIQLQEYDKALDLVRERLKFNTDDLLLLSLRAHIQEKQGKIEEAIKSHKKILTIKGDYINSLNSLGFLLINDRQSTQEEIELAIDCLKKALAMQPENPAYLDSFGVLLANLGNPVQAQKALEKAQAKLPDNEEIQQHIQQLALQPKKETKIKSVVPPVAQSTADKPPVTPKIVAKNEPSQGEAGIVMQEAKTLMEEIMQHSKDFENL